MIRNPYATLRELGGHRAGWMPAWAERLEVHRTETGITTYSAHPIELTHADLADLHELAAAGWHVAIDGPRLGRIRVRTHQ